MTSDNQNDQQQQDQKVELAVFNLESTTHLTDQQMIAHQVERYLQVCGQTSLSQVQGGANVPMVANIYALTGSVLDLVLYATQPFEGDAGVKQTALMAANLIGLFLSPQNEAHARVALRPMLGVMAECLYKDGGKIREGDLKRMALHLNAHIAGDLEDFLIETAGKLPGLLASATTLGTTILTGLTVSASGGAASGGASADQRDPNQQFMNWASPLAELLQLPSAADLTPKIPVLDVAPSFLQIKATAALATLANAIQQHGSPLKYSLSWLIGQTLQALKDNKNKGNASVPINQTGEYERHSKGDTLEFVTLQANALNAPPCPGQASNTVKSINYAIGAERVEHVDFYLPKIGFGFSRLYNSQLAEYDDSAIGARWMMPFSNQIIRRTQDFILIDAKGRKHSIPHTVLMQAYEVPYEGIQIQALEDGRLTVNFGTDWNFYFQSFNEGLSYQLVFEENPKTQEHVTLNYLTHQQFAFLQSVDFKLKRASQTLKFAYDKQLNIIAIFADEDAAPLARYVYDTDANLIQAFDQNGHSRQYSYNHAHQLTRYTDRTGRGQNIRYESTLPNAKAIEEWADDGSFKTRLEWHPRLRQVAVYNADDVPTYYYFDLDGFTYRTRLTDGREEWYSRDKHKRITRHIDFFGRETQQEYDDAGQLTQVVQPNGGIIRFAYDDQGQVTETKDPEGNIWKQEYDAKGNVSKQIDPLGQITQFKYNMHGQVTEITDAKGGKKSLQYNSLGLMTAFSDCSGKTSAWVYAEDGKLLSETSAEGQTVEYQYSQLGKDKGQLKAVIYPDGLKESFERDEEGRLLKHIDTTGQVTSYDYNRVGLLEQRRDANRNQIRYQWDRAGRLTKLLNQNQAEYVFNFNQYGQLVSEQAFDGEEKQFEYTENGLLLEMLQPNVRTVFAYHPDGQVSDKHFIHRHSREQQSQHFDYNLNNQLSVVRNEHSQNQYYYNKVGQLVREHQHYQLADLKPMTAVLRYEYDVLGNLSKTIRPDGQEHAVLSYGSGHVYGVAFNKQELVAFQRDDLHRETTRMLANGLMQSSTYNDVGLLSSQRIFAEDQPEQHYQASRSYQYDKNYLLTQVDDSRLGTLNYQYDPIGRLIKSQSAHLSESFDFDPAGNLIDSTQQGSTVKNNLIKSYQGKSYKYDAQGNVIETQHAGKNLKLTWDNLNRLSRSELNGKVTDYAYDVFGRRIYKKSQDTGTTLFGWDGDLMVWESVQATDEADNYTKHYIYEPNSFVPMVQAGYGSFIKLLDTPDYSQFKDQPYSMQRDPVWKTDNRYNRAEIERAIFYHCDQVGTPQSLSNEAGDSVWQITQDTWGKALEIKASDNLLEQTNIRFQGQYYDTETGLHYNRYRYYEPRSAPYIGKDPIGLDGGLNTSAYVSDPNGWVDPMGLMPNNDKGLFWMTPESRKNSDLEVKRSEDHAKTKTQKSNLDWSRSESGYPKEPKKTVTNTTADVDRVDFPQIQGRPSNQNSAQSTFLSRLLPSSAGQFEKNAQNRQYNQGLANIRNGNLALAGAAVYGTYPGAAASRVVIASGAAASRATINGVSSAKNAWGAASGVTKATISGAGGAAGVEMFTQGIEGALCKCNTLDIPQIAASGTIGALGGTWGGTMAGAAGVEYVSIMNIVKNTKNTSGLVIFANQKAIEQSMGKAVGSALENNKNHTTEDK